MDNDQLPPGPRMLPRELREKLAIPDRCPGCNVSFGVTGDWADLLAKVTAHLAAGSCDGKPAGS